jgi:hypothetical protein
MLTVSHLGKVNTSFGASDSPSNYEKHPVHAAAGQSNKNCRRCDLKSFSSTTHLERENLMRVLYSITCVTLGISGLILSGCVQGGATTPTLTAEQEQAIAAALTSVEGLVASSQNARVTTDAEEEEQAARANQDLRARDFEFGVCPVVRVTDGEGENPPSLTLDFGMGCTPEWAPGVICSGAITGTISLAQREMSLIFTDHTCGDFGIDGSATYGWRLQTGQVSLTGDTDITTTDAGQDPFRYDANGSLTYTSADLTTTIEEYDGFMSYDNEEWGLLLANTPVSYPTYSNYVPFDGSATVTASEGSDNVVTVYFDPNSPVTGMVEVSINGGPRFDWQINGF